MVFGVFHFDFLNSRFNKLSVFINISQIEIYFWTIKFNIYILKSFGKFFFPKIKSLVGIMLHLRLLNHEKFQ